MSEQLHEEVWTPVREVNEEFTAWLEREDRWDAYVDWAQNQEDSLRGGHNRGKEGPMLLRPNDLSVKVSSLTSLLTGEHECLWAAWFQAHHPDFEKKPDTFDLAKWKMEHTELLADTRALLEEKGYIVTSEWQNKFYLRGTTGIVLVGKPDLIAVKPDRRIGLLIDGKTGKRKESHSVQVMIGMYAVPRFFKEYLDITFRGRVVYRQGENVKIPSEAVDDEFRKRLFTLLRKVGGEAPARRVPSVSECRFCPITARDCPQKIEPDQEREPVDVEDF